MTDTDAATSADLRSDDVLEALRDRGFEWEVEGRHVIATRDATRLVLPAPGRRLPPMFLRRLDHSLRGLLGPGWLVAAPRSDRSSPSPSSLPEVHRLDAVVDRCSTSGNWCAFLLCEPSIMGFAPTREGALADLRTATALWVGIPKDRVALRATDGV
jgi:hypothetical protein